MVSIELKKNQIAPVDGSIEILRSLTVWKT